MNFSTNLQTLRKQYNLSQEQLAEKVDVSRQAVSKWENGSSYPEMDKLMMICDLFDVSMDTLVKEDIVFNENLNKDDKELYENAFNKFSKMVTLGVGLILLGVSFMCMFEANFNKGNFFNPFSTVVFFILVTIAVFLFVYYGISYGNFKEEHPYFEDFYTKEEKSSFNRLFAGMMSLGVGIILFAVTVIVAVEEFLKKDADAVPGLMGLFMIMITIAVAIFTYFGMQKSKYDIEEYNKEHNKKYRPEEYGKKDNEDLIGKISGVIMLIATFIFLLLGFVLDLWHPGWAVFPLGGVLCAIVSVVLSNDR